MSHRTLIKHGSVFTAGDAAAMAQSQNDHLKGNSSIYHLLSLSCFCPLYLWVIITFDSLVELLEIMLDNINQDEERKTDSFSKKSCNHIKTNSAPLQKCIYNSSLNISL